MTQNRPEWPTENRINQIGLNGATGKHYATHRRDDALYRIVGNTVFYWSEKYLTWKTSAHMKQWVYDNCEEITI